MQLSNSDVDEILAQFPGPVTLRPAKLKQVIVLAGFSLLLVAGFVICSAYGFGPERHALAMAVGFLCITVGFIGAMGAGAVLSSNMVRLTLDKDGFTVFREGRCCGDRWQNIRGPATGPIRHDGAAALSNELNLALLALAAENLILSDDSTTLGDTYQLKTQNLLRLVAEWQTRALAGHEHQAATTNAATSTETVPASTRKVDEILARFPGPVVLAPRYRKDAVYLALFAAATGIMVLFVLGTFTFEGWLLLGVFAILTMAFATRLIFGENDLVLTEAGFERLHLVQRRFTKWEQVRLFEATSFGFVSYSDSAFTAFDLLNLLGGGPVGRAIVDDFDLSGEDLTWLLNRWREKALASRGRATSSPNRSRSA